MGLEEGEEEKEEGEEEEEEKERCFTVPSQGDEALNVFNIT